MQNLPRRAAHLILFFLAFGYRAFAQPDSTLVKKDSVDFYEMSLDQLLKMKAHGVPSELEKLINSLISVASKKPLNTRESPAIVSLITEDEIKKSGARDLIDVLRLVPGFDFGVDVEGVVGIGLRGNWAHEGKVLVLLDGQETNEILFGTTQLGNHYPIDQIKRIEIIRGPGSAIYGGFAEYGVINIITKKGEDLNGVSASGTYGQFQKDFAQKSISLATGQKLKDLQYSISGLISAANRSDRTYTDLSGSSYKMGGNSGLNSKYLNGSISYKGLSFRAIADLYETTMRDGYTNTVSSKVTSHFNSYYAEFKYLIKVNDKLSITPRVNFKSQTPWQSDSYDGKDAYSKTASRSTENVIFSYDLNRQINFVAGTEFYQDKASDHSDSSYFVNGKQTVTYNNYAFFAQGLVKTRPVNIILGARYDKHSAYGDAFVPRVGLTKAYGRFHFKALYSGAFRAPAIENINYSAGTGIKPELTRVAELELGYQVTRRSIITVNVFDITTSNPIVFSTDSFNNDFYANSGSAGSQGIEAEYRIRAKWGQVMLNYAYYTALNKTRVPDYAVDEDKNALAAFANQKLNLSVNINLSKDLTINTGLSFYGTRWAYTTLDSSGTSVITKLDPLVLANVFLNYKTPAKGLSVGVGVYNLLDSHYDFVQPYNGYHAPLPGPSREFMLKLRYELKYKAAN